VRLDQTPEGGKVRLTAAAALDGVAGAWGDGDMLCVALNAAGEIILATNNDVIGVIWTPEGRKTPATGSAHKNVIGGRKYTVFSRAEFVESEVGSSPTLTNGDLIYATALGDVLIVGMAVGDQFVGYVAADLNGTGSRLVVDIGLLPAA